MINPVLSKAHQSAHLGRRCAWGAATDPRQGDVNKRNQDAQDAQDA